MNLKWTDCNLSIVQGGWISSLFQHQVAWKTLNSRNLTVNLLLICNGPTVQTRVRRLTCHPPFSNQTIKANSRNHSPAMGVSSVAVSSYSIVPQSSINRYKIHTGVLSPPIRSISCMTHVSKFPNRRSLQTSFPPASILENKRDVSIPLEGKKNPKSKNHAV